MRKLKHVMTILFASFSLYSVAQQPFTAGNIVVSRVGSGSGVISAPATEPVFLDEYTPAGVLVQTIALPSATGQKLTISGNTGANLGLLNLSNDGRYITMTGWDEIPGTDISATPAGHNRSIAMIDYNGNLSSMTVVTNNPNNSNIHSALTDDGTNLWFDGSGSVEYVPTGGSTSTLLATPTSSANYLNYSNGVLYLSTQITSTPLVTVGSSGLPTTAGQTLITVPGFPSRTRPQQFAFADLDQTVAGPDVIYLASQNPVSPGGIQKYSLVGGTWVFNGVVGSTADKYLGIAVKVSGTTVTIFGTRKGTNTDFTILGGELVTLTDNTGYNPGPNTFVGTPTVLADIPTRFGGADFAAFRGIALVPQGPSVKVSIKAFLQGAYSNSLTRHKDVTTTWAAVLNANALSQPYNVAPFNYAGTESVSNGFFTSNSGSTSDILDWVLLELRSSDNATLVARKAAFIREDGQIVDTDGSSAVTFNGVGDGNYYVVVKHRNHLNVRSANSIALTSMATSYDFTTGQGQAFTNGAISNTPMAAKDLLGTGTSVTMLWGGNANSDGLVRASAGATVNDYLTLMSPANLNGNTSTILNNVYRSVDMNLDGTVRASAGATVNDYLTLMSPGILNGNTSNILTAHN